MKYLAQGRKVRELIGFLYGNGAPHLLGQATYIIGRVLEFSFRRAEQEMCARLAPAIYVCLLSDESGRPTYIGRAPRNMAQRTPFRRDGSLIHVTHPIDTAPCGMPSH